MREQLRGGVTPDGVDRAWVSFVWIFAIRSLKARVSIHTSLHKWSARSTCSSSDSPASSRSRAADQQQQRLHRRLERLRHRKLQISDMVVPSSTFGQCLSCSVHRAADLSRKRAVRMRGQTACGHISLVSCLYRLRCKLSTTCLILRTLREAQLSDL